MMIVVVFFFDDSSCSFALWNICLLVAPAGRRRRRLVLTWPFFFPERHEENPHDRLTARVFREREGKWVGRYLCATRGG